MVLLGNIFTNAFVAYYVNISFYRFPPGLASYRVVMYFLCSFYLYIRSALVFPIGIIISSS
jgi:hypothetical protein